MKYAGKIFVAIVLLAASYHGRAWAQGLVEEPLRIPMREAGSRGLEAFMVRPDDNLAHPLALITHGTPRDLGQRSETSALGLVPQAREFAAFAHRSRHPAARCAASRGS